ncbi:hypothetical protein [Kordia sp.]|uniref:hypothetical protein n=1 Tax=Kordia sp. TaxID=1965332 RepID=UPI003D266A2A
METTINDSFSTFGIFITIYQIVIIALLIIVIVLGIKLVLKLFKLMNSQTALNKAKLQKLQDDL